MTTDPSMKARLDANIVVANTKWGGFDAASVGAMPDAVAKPDRKSCVRPSSPCAAPTGLVELIKEAFSRRKLSVLYSQVDIPAQNLCYARCHRSSPVELPDRPDVFSAPATSSKARIMPNAGVMRRPAAERTFSPLWRSLRSRYCRSPRSAAAASSLRA